MTLPALFCGVALLASIGGRRTPRRLTGRRRVVALHWRRRCLRVALVAHVGNRATAASIAAIERGEPERALAQARRAIDWAPWSTSPGSFAARPSWCSTMTLRRAGASQRRLERNPESWSIWLDLAVVSRGKERERALAEAKRLNPLSPEIAELQAELQTEP